MKTLFSVCLISCLSLTQLMGKNQDPPHAALKLWYTKPAKSWMLQALPIGNGHMGAMIFGAVEKEHIQFNEKSLWSGNQLDVTNSSYQQKMDDTRALLALGKIPEADELLKQAGGFPREHFGSFQPFGDVNIEFDHGDIATNYHRELDLSKSLLTVTYTVKGVNYKREYFASFPDQVVVMRITASQKGKINMRVTMNTPQKEGKLIINGNQSLIMNGKIPGNGMLYSSHLNIQPEGGIAKANGNGIEVKNASSAVLLLSAKTSYAMNWPISNLLIDPDLMVVERIKKASKKTYKQLFQAHLADYQHLFNRVQLELDRPQNRIALPTDEALIAYSKANQAQAKNGGDPSLEALLFNYGRYLMIASSRKGALPANLQGIWNNSKQPAWDSDYHTDINLEMNYWINGPTNLPECFDPFVDYVDFLRKPGKIAAEKYFKARGFFVNIYTNPWGYAEPRWPWTGASGWLCQNLYDHFLFTGNQRYLRDKAYPIMKDACLFYLDVLIPYKDKSLVVAPSVSPEISFRFNNNTSYRTSAGASIDQQVVHDLFTNTIEAASVLKIDAELISKLQDVLKRLSAPVKVGKNETIQEWVEDWQAEDLEHRHISHLFSLYPGKMIDPSSTPKWAQAAANSLKLRGDNQTGWGSAWRIACYARLGKGEEAYEFFKSLIRNCTDSNIVYRNGGGTYENLLMCHSPFQIDANFGYAAAVAEMLLQSHLGDWKNGYEIHLLPALPKAWINGKVKGLMARGEISVDMEWKAGNLVQTVISSKRGGRAKISYKGKVVDLKISKGKSIVLDFELKTI